MLIFGQTRIFFVMSRDGLLPEMLSRVHPKFRTPHVVTAITGVAVAVAAAFFPVGQLADISNAGTLYAFMMVAVAVMVLRKTRPASSVIFGWERCGWSLRGSRWLRVPVLQPADGGDAVTAGLGVIGMVVYVLYSRSHSHLGRGIIEVVDDVAGEETQIPIHPPEDR